MPIRSEIVSQIITATLLKLLLNTGRRFIYPFAPAISRGLEVPLTAITAIIATSQAASLLGLFSGPLADRVGYRLMMRTGLATLAVGMLACGLFPSYWPLFCGLVLASLGKTLFDPAIQAYVGQKVAYEKRGRIIGLIEISWAGSTLCGIPALALIIEYAGLPSSFWVMAILGFVGWLTIGRVFPKDSTVSEQMVAPLSMRSSLRKIIGNRATAGMLAFGFWISLANDCLFVTYGAWFETAFQVTIVTLGFSTVAIGVAELLGESITALLADRIGLKRTIVISLTLAVFAYLLLPFIGHTLPLAMVGLFFVFLLFEITMVTSFSLGTELLPNARATMMAGYYAAAGIGRMVGVVVGGLLWQWGGITNVAYCAGFFSVVGLGCLLWGLRGWKAPAVVTDRSTNAQW